MSTDYLINEANSLLTYVATPPEIVSIPFYYDNPVVNEAASVVTDGSMYAVQTLSLAYKVTGNKTYRDKTIEILNAWATINKGWEKNDAVLEVPLKFQSFIEAAELIGGWDDTIFRRWLNNVYMPSCNNIKDRWNNWGVIGICGSIQANKYLGSSFSKDISMLKEFINWSVAGSWNPFGRKGELWVENLRNNSGLHYYFFCLSPMLKAIWLSKQIALYPKLRNTIEIFYQYCLHPETWPYKKYRTISWLQQWVFPSYSSLDLVGPNELFEVAGHLYGNPLWEAYSMEYRRSNYWSWAKIRIEQGLI